VINSNCVTQEKYVYRFLVDVKKIKL
jgi:hypothetical protein